MFIFANVFFFFFFNGERQKQKEGNFYKNNEMKLNNVISHQFDFMDFILKRIIIDLKFDID